MKIAARTIFGALFTMLMLTACAAPSPSPVAYGSRALRGLESREVFEAAELALLDAGFQIDRRDYTEGVLTTQPIFGGPDSGSSDSRPRLSSRGDVRRVAELRVQKGVEEVNIYCRVLVQEQSSQIYRIVNQQGGSDDRPNTTPIERDAATTTQQNTVWRTLRRDKVTEQQILSQIDERVGPAKAPDPGGQGP